MLLIEAWARNGLSDEQISHNMGIAPGTLYEWKKRYPTINEALKKGKEVVDIEVENALFKRAIGYYYAEKRVESTANGEKTVTTTKHMPGDTAAQIFWLRNRKPESWSNNPELTDAEQDQIHRAFELLEGVGGVIN